MSLGDSLDFFTRLSGTAVAHSFDAFWRSLNSDNPLDVNTTPIKSSLQNSTHTCCMPPSRPGGNPFGVEAFCDCVVRESLPSQFSQLDSGHAF
jgi:hypothetical protein